MKRFAKGHRYPGTDSDKWTIRAYPLEWPRLCPLISNSSPFFFLFFSFFVIFPWTSFFDPVTRPVIYYRVKMASMKASDNYARGEERRGWRKRTRVQRIRRSCVENRRIYQGEKTRETYLIRAKIRILCLSRFKKNIIAKGFKKLSIIWWGI